MKTWLKGGIIGLIIGIILFIILFFTNCFSLFNCAAEATCGNPYSCMQKTALLILAGLVVGLIIGRIKS